MSRKEIALKKVGAAVLIIAAAIFGYWFLHRQEKDPIIITVPDIRTAMKPDTDKQAPLTGVVRRDPPASTPAASSPAPLTPEEGVASSGVPAKLEQSDDAVRQAAEALDPDLPRWLLPEEQLRKWVMLVNLVADGKIPLRNRPFDISLPPFRVLQNSEGLVPDPANYARVTPVLQILTRIPPAQLAYFYHEWQPLLQQAYAELGNGDSFETRLQAALTRVQSIPPASVAPPSSAMMLIQGERYYLFANPQQEVANSLEKLFWRIGPDNTQRLQNYLAELQPLL